MNLWKRLRKLSVSQLFKLGWVFVKNPLLIVPTYRATKTTFEICNRLYGSTHHKSNKANAFRHVLWNVLICVEVEKRLKSDAKSAIWAQNVTDLYENVTNNTLLEQIMDLHNNQIGRTLFLSHSIVNSEETVILIQNKLQNAQKLSEIEKIEDYKEILVYISE